MKRLAIAFAGSLCLFALSMGGCGYESNDESAEDGADAAAGGTAGKGGSAGKGGTSQGGSSQGGSSQGGSSQGGSSQGGSSGTGGGQTGGAAGSAGTGGTAGAAGAAGTGGAAGSAGTGGTAGAAGTAGTGGAAGAAGAAGTGGAAGSGGRVTADLVALYEFKESSGTVAHDTSGVSPALDLSWTAPDASPPVHWVTGGLSFGGAALVATAGPATKIITACKASDEITIEAWVKSANVTQQGPARIVTLSPDINNRNFSLGQIDSTFDLRLRTSDSFGGLPSLQTNNNVVDPAALQHVIYTRSAAATEGTLYIDAAIKKWNTVTGTFDNWDDSYKLLIGNEASNDRPWVGEVHLVAIYSRALTGDEIKKNYWAGAN